MSLIELAYLGMTVVLSLSGAVIVYPALKGVQVVVYRRAVLALGTSILLFVASWLVVFLYLFEVLDLRTVTLLSLGGNTVAGALHFAAVWWFARDFVEVERTDVGQTDVDIGGEQSANGGFTNESE